MIRQKQSPAEQLAETKQRNRPKRNGPAKSEAVLWVTELSKFRESLNLSMRDVAQAVGLSSSAYFRIENGYADVSLSNAMALSEFFGVPIDHLWKSFKQKQ